jgi:hypothetical protein
MVRCVAFVVLGCAFSALFWFTVQTHRLYPATPMPTTASIAIGTLR